MDSFTNEATTKLEVLGNGSIIFVDYKAINISSFIVHNERGDTEEFHKDHMLWKIPSEHTLDNRQFAAELQVYFMQSATNRRVALSFFFDTELENAVTDARRLKTCFIDSFEFEDFNLNMAASPPRDAGLLRVPLKEFINFLPDEYVYYEGSETVPDCEESLSWIINIHPHVITKDQLQ